ncbi:hypothetical protein MRB53_022630 [Persea americana]|uniref:Uncharacterized protein n=1 Tax=Persea americana TaxID=3435 RepID=A0ACC2L770_PERAE|nr:hypothetical protein MRB53_022630 [Persea americana]
MGRSLISILFKSMLIQTRKSVRSRILGEESRAKTVAPKGVFLFHCSTFRCTRNRPSVVWSTELTAQIVLSSGQICIVFLLLKDKHL